MKEFIGLEPTTEQQDAMDKLLIEAGSFLFYLEDKEQPLNLDDVTAMGIMALNELANDISYQFQQSDSSVVKELLQKQLLVVRYLIDLHISERVLEFMQEHKDQLEESTL